MNETIHTKHGEINTETQGFFGTYYKVIDEREHKFNKFNGYGFSDYELDEMKTYMVNRVIVKVTQKDGTKKILMTTYETIMKRGEDYLNKSECDHQKVLNECHFVVKGIEE